MVSVLYTIALIQPVCSFIDFFVTGTFIRVKRPCSATIVFTRQT